MARTRDDISGATYNERIEDAYKQLIDQAKEWRREDPQAQIRVVDMGLSRGAVEAAGLARLIDERGIQDPAGAIYTKNHDNQITHVEYTKAPLVAPGHVAQAELLFDPVATGYALKHEDLRPPPSMMSGMQITAADEHRSEFKSIHIIDPGMTPDGRFLGVSVAGAHSDIGGSYTRNGLGLRSENLAIGYLNSFSDTPFLQRVAVPDDPSLNVVHRSEQVAPFNFMPTTDRATPAGNIERLVPQETHYHTTQTAHGAVTTVTHNERPGVSDPFNAEPRDPTMSHALEQPAGPIAQPPVPLMQPPIEAPALDPTRLQQRALHGESSQVDRAQEAQRQQETQGHTAAREAPLPAAAAAIAPGMQVPPREAPARSYTPSPASPSQDQTAAPARTEPTPPATDPNHAALAAQQAHQQAMMHAQRQAQQERQQREERSAPNSRAAPPLEPGRVIEAAALTPLAASSLREATTVAPAVAIPVAGSLRDDPAPAQMPSRTDPQASTPSRPEAQRPEPGHVAASPANTAGMASPAAHQVAHDPAAPVLSPPLDPPSMRDFRHAEHPLNPRYQMFRDALGEQGFHQDRPNPLLAMRGGDHSGDHLTGAHGNINVLNPTVMADYQQRCKTNQAAFDQLSGDLQRERDELARALHQMENGTQPVHLPPDVQRQLVEYRLTCSDTLMQHAA